MAQPACQGDDRLAGLSDWAHNETNNYTTFLGIHHGIDDSKSDPGPSLFLAAAPTS
ncbi:hypothetical protein [Streptomyces sp. NPDC059479]|uniref:hypothetical protein n=1 Tax=Streptomyces sp. NPDC059479 TaxID=3346848 RepID=UPI0036CF54A5